MVGWSVSQSDNGVEHLSEWIDWLACGFPSDLVNRPGCLLIIAVLRYYWTYLIKLGVTNRLNDNVK